MTGAAGVFQRFRSLGADQNSSRTPGNLQRQASQRNPVAQLSHSNNAVLAIIQSALNGVVPLHRFLQFPSAGAWASLRIHTGLGRGYLCGSFLEIRLGIVELGSRLCFCWNLDPGYNFVLLGLISTRLARRFTTFSICQISLSRFL